MTNKYKIDNIGKSNIIIELNEIGEFIFRDGEKEYKFNKKQFIKKFCLEEK